MLLLSCTSLDRPVSLGFLISKTGGTSRGEVKFKLFIDVLPLSSVACREAKPTADNKAGVSGKPEFDPGSHLLSAYSGTNYLSSPLLVCQVGIVIVATAWSC